MANRIVSVHAGIYGMGIYAIMLPSSGFSIAHWWVTIPEQIPWKLRKLQMTNWSLLYILCPKIFNDIN